jgi:hypothetical protein
MGRRPVLLIGLTLFMAMLSIIDPSLFVEDGTLDFFRRPVGLGAFPRG